MAEVLSNLVQTTVNQGAGVAATDVSIDVADASAFPGGGDFRIVINDEIMLVTGVAGNTLTVDRGQEGTVGTAHQDGAIVSVIFTAGGFGAFVAGSGGGGGTPVWSADFQFAAGGQALVDGVSFSVVFDTILLDSHGLLPGGSGNSGLLISAAGDGVWWIAAEAVISAGPLATGLALIVNGVSAMSVIPQDAEVTPLPGSGLVRAQALCPLAAGAAFTLDVTSIGDDSTLNYAAISLVRICGVPV